MSEQTLPDAAVLRRPQEGFGWDGVDRLAYKQDAAAPFLNVSRQTLFSRADLAGEIRYFEIAAGGHTTLERHNHVHGVMVLRGRGRCLVGTQVEDIGELDLITIPAWTWHQLRAAADAPLGFLCLVDSARDRPVLPMPEDIAALRAHPQVSSFLDG